MKWFSNIIIPGIFAVVIIGCDNRGKNDSNTVAEQKNDENFDSRIEENQADFVADAIESNYAEIKMAELASTKSSNKKIQDFAQELVNDQTKTLTELQTFAGKKGITIPVEEGEETKEKINELAKQGEPDFDKKWCDELIAKHKKSIREFELMLDKSEDPELKGIVNHALINLRAKLDELNSLEKHIM